MVATALPASTWLLAVSIAAEVDDAADPGLLPLIAAIVIALPMAGVLAFFIWVKVRDRDDPSGPMLKPGSEPPDDGDGD